jgi:hypothetical protein
LVGFGSVNGVIDWQEMFIGKGIHPFDQQRFARARFECGTWA